MFGSNKKNQMEPKTKDEVAEFQDVTGKKIMLKDRLKQYGKAAMACLALVAVLAITLIIIFHKSVAPEIYFYGDNSNCLYVGEMKKPNKVQLLTTQCFYDSLLKEDLVEESLVQITKDGEQIFYPEEIKEDGSFSLYMKEYGKKESQGQLLMRDVVFYKVIDPNRIITLKNDGSLYYIKGEEHNCLSFLAKEFWVAENGKSVLWLEMSEEGESELNFRKLNLKKEEKVLQIGVEKVLSVSKDLNRIYYLKDENLYQISKQGKEEIVLENLKEWYGQEGEWEGFYCTIGEQNELYYSNGEELQFIDQDVYKVLVCGPDFLMYSIKEDEVKWYIAKGTAISRVDLDDILESGNELYNLFTMDEVLRSKKCDIAVDKEKECIYLLNLNNKKSDLYSISYKEGSVGLTEKIDSDVQTIEAVNSEAVYYTKNVSYKGSSLIGEIYKNGEMVLKEAIVGYGNSKEATFFYYKDWVTKEHTGTLMRLKGEKGKKIAENVYEYQVYLDKLVFIKTDWTDGIYTLSYYNGRKVKKISENVLFFEVIQKIH